MTNNHWYLGQLAAGVCICALALSARPGRAADIVHTQTDESPIASMVTIPPGMTTYYLSGMVAPVSNPNAPKGSIESYGDTKTQTIGAIGKIKEALAAQKLGLEDVVMMHVYLA